MSLKILLSTYKRAWKLFSDRQASQLAASSSFYIILTIVPFLLLTTRVVGLFFNGPEDIYSYVIEVSGYTFPEIAPELLIKIKALVAKPLQGGTSFTIINSFLLLISCLTFFNSLWGGLYLLSGDMMFLSWKRHLRAFGMLGMMILIVFFSFLLQPVLKWLGIPFGLTIWQFFIFWIAFSLTYYWLFGGSGKKREAVLASATFVGLLIGSKGLFWLYLLAIRSSVEINYGEYYLIFVGAIWVFLFMNLFFYGLSLCIVMRENSPFEKLDKLES